MPAGRFRCLTVALLLVPAVACAASIVAEVSAPLAINPRPALGTYLGGSLNDEVVAVGVDALGNIYVVGATGSTDFPTAPPATYPPPFLRKSFLSKLDPSGTTLLWSSVLEGFASPDSVLVGVRAMAVDGAGNVYLTGSTVDNLPVVNAVQPTFGGGFNDAFVAKFDATGTLAFSTYLGGGGHDTGTGIAVDPSGRVHVVGETTSSTAEPPSFPVLHAWQATASGFSEGFVAQFDGNGGLEYATFLGGTGGDQFFAVATNASGDTWIAGVTYTGAFPTMSGSWRPVSVPGPFLRSTDGGKTWTPSTKPLSGDQVTALAADPAVGSTVYAGTSTGAIYRSVDGGDTWMLLYQTASPAIGVVALAIDRIDSMTIYAAVGTQGTGSVLRSRNGGATWTIANVGLPATPASSLIPDPSHRDTVYATSFGLYRSRDAGDTWTPVIAPDGLAGVLAIDPKDSDHLVLAGSQHVGQSFDGGLTWEVSEEMFGMCPHGDCTDIGAIFFDPMDSKVIYLTGSFGSAKTTDGGAQWDRNFSCLADLRLSFIYPGDPPTLYGVGKVSQFAPYHAIRSNDGGASWSSSGLSDIGFGTVVEVAQGTPPRLYSGFESRVSENVVVRLDVSGTPVFSTYAGASGTALSVDADGNVFLPALALDGAGMPLAFATPGQLDPATITALQIDAGGRVHILAADNYNNRAAFVADFDSADPDDGVCTPLPAVHDSLTFTSLALNAAGDAYVGITTTATDAAVSGAYQPTNAGGSDAFVAKFTRGEGGAMTNCPGPPTTTTTLPPVSCVPHPTTTTLPPACGADLSGARCRLTRFLDEPACASESVTTRLRKFIASKVARTQVLLERAEATAGEKRKRALRWSNATLRAVQKRANRSARRRKLSGECRNSLHDRLEEIRQMILVAR